MRIIIQHYLQDIKHSPAYDQGGHYNIFLYWIKNRSGISKYDWLISLFLASNEISLFSMYLDIYIYIYGFRLKSDEVDSLRLKTLSFDMSVSICCVTI